MNAVAVGTDPRSTPTSRTTVAGVPRDLDLPDEPTRIVVMVRCSNELAARAHADRWDEGGGREVQVGHDGDGLVVGATFASVFDALFVLGAVTSEMTLAPDEAAAVVAGPASHGASGAVSTDQGRAGDAARGRSGTRERAAQLLGTALPGQCLVLADVGLIAGPLLGPGLDLVAAGARGRHGFVCGPGVYDIRAARGEGRRSSCTRPQWARRRVHGAPGPSGVAVAPRTTSVPEPAPSAAARVVCFVGPLRGALEVATAQAALAAHADGSQVLRVQGRPGDRRELAALVELVSAYAHDRGPDLVADDLCDELDAIAVMLPDLAARIGAARPSGRRARTRARTSSNLGRDRLDLVDRVLRTIVSNGPTTIVATSVDDIDALSQVVVERVVGDRRLHDVRLVVGGLQRAPRLVGRLKDQLGALEVVEVEA
ncbi:hypothetical protein [Sanguibacter suaedae]|uniref:Uncharacterized protein n=1 Tax=Sanguibacter suaedae TaxID=2795737 RepID=A0A934MDZ6_9MICO|nr:hypothetical protein [Sanguibacter suaedae]MBI9115244.1 hypothetical protein [Sanguibacter suaedae]